VAGSGAVRAGVRITSAVHANYVYERSAVLSVPLKGGVMHLKKALSVVLCVWIVAAATFALTGCAAKTAVWGDLDTGLILEYRMSSGDAMSYRFTSSSIQTMEIQGQAIPVESIEILSFSAESKGVTDGEFALGITIDGLTVTVSSPQGELEADTDDIVGESFDMTLSKVGVEGGLPDRDALQYTIGPEGPKSVITGFGVIFADLPEGPITVGDTWPTTVEIVEESDESNIVITIDAINTLEGFETVDGLECAKMAVVLTGTIEGSGTQQGAAWTMQSDMDGVGTWYFAYKEGILVRDATEGTADGTIVLHTPNGEMTIPVSREYGMITELMK